MPFPWTQSPCAWWLVGCLATAPTLAVHASTAPHGISPSVQLAGQRLQLNGAGVSQRLVFDVYAAGLYLSEPQPTADAVLTHPGPRRLLIQVLRDISAKELDKAILHKLASETPHLRPAVAEQLERLGRAFMQMTHGLRPGDQLTLDWIPGTGAVVAHNQQRITAPLPDMEAYNALLKVWLGESPTDRRLKTALLGGT